MEQVLDVTLSLKKDLLHTTLSVCFLTDHSTAMMAAFDPARIRTMLGRVPKVPREVIELPVDQLIAATSDPLRDLLQELGTLFANAGLAVQQEIDLESRYHLACAMGLDSEAVDITNWRAGIYTDSAYSEVLSAAGVPAYWFNV